MVYLLTYLHFVRSSEEEDIEDASDYGSDNDDYNNNETAFVINNNETAPVMITITASVIIIILCDYNNETECLMTIMIVIIHAAM